MAQVVLDTPRLALRPLTLEDVCALQKIGTDDVFKLVPEIETPFDATAWVTHKLENEDPPVCHVVSLKSSIDLIGFCQASAAANLEERRYEFSVGYWFGQKYWGNRYATEAITAVMEHLDASYGGYPVRAKVHRNNAASRKVLENCGFSTEQPIRGAAPQKEMLLYCWHKRTSGHALRS